MNGMIGKKSGPESGVSFFMIPADTSQIKKVHFSARNIRLLIAGGVLGVFLFVFNVAGFFYYRSLFGSLDQKRATYAAYEKEREELINKVSLLESTVGEAEKLTGRLASLVGTERLQLTKGIGPIKTTDADSLSKTQGIDLTALDPKMDRISERAISLQAKIQELSKIQSDKLVYIASTPSLWPVKGWVTSDFGRRRSPFTRAADFHEGIDIATSWGTPILAPADGIVTFSGYKGGYGKMITIDHGFGISTKFAHASELVVKDGEKVKRGMVIARVGSTGHSTGPHLHYEIHQDGVPVDPMKYILR